MIRTLLAHVKQYKRATILTPIMMIGEVVMETLIPLITAMLIDQGIQQGDMSKTWLYGLAMLAMAFASLAFGIGGGRYGAQASAGFAANLRNAMYENIQTFSFSNIDKFSTAGLVTRMTTDVTNMQNAFQMVLRIAVRAPLQLIFSMVMCFIIAPDLSLIFLGAIVFLGVCLGLIVKVATKRFSKLFEKYDGLNASVQENVSAIRVVKAFVREDYESKKFNKAAKALRDFSINAEKIVILNNPIMMTVVYACIILLSWLGAQHIVAGSLTTGELTSLFSYVMTSLMSLMMLSMIFVMLTMSLASGKRICEVLNEKADLVNPENPVMDVKDGSVDFDHVTFAYKTGTGEPTLKDIDIHIKSGETIGIIGGTGCGKSSLVNLISRLYDVQSGAVRVGGLDVRKYDLEALRNAVSVVLQKNVLFSGSFLDNLRWGKEDATLEEAREACRLACADEFVEAREEGYDTHVEQGGNNVSGGQKQRLCIARALLKHPKVLILDDSTSAVDTATDAKIRQAFATKIPGTTKLIIAQRISSVMDADRILVLDNGQVNGFGSHDELMQSNEIYREIYETQTQGGGDFDQPGQNGGVA